MHNLLKVKKNIFFQYTTFIF